MAQLYGLPTTRYAGAFLIELDPLIDWSGVSGVILATDGSAWLDYTNLPTSGDLTENRVLSREISDGADMPVRSLRAVLHMNTAAGSISSGAVDSPYNLLSGGFSPAIFGRRRIIVQDPLGSPSSSDPEDWRPRFWGRIDDHPVNSAGDLQIFARDLSAQLMVPFPGPAAWIGTEGNLIPLDEAIQSVLDATQGTETWVLKSGSGDFEWAIPAFELASSTDVLQTIRDAAQQRGLVIRWWPDEETGRFQLTLMELQVEKEDADFVYTAAETVDIPAHGSDLVSYRNDFTLNYSVGGTQFTLHRPATQAEKDAFGLQPLVITEASTSQINSDAEGNTMLDSVEAALRVPATIGSRLLPLNPLIEINSLLTFGSDGRVSQEPVSLYVTGWTERIVANGTRVERSTRVELRGAPVGQIGAWLSSFKKAAGRTEVSVPISAYSLIGFREIKSPDPLYRRFAWVGMGAKVSRVFAASLPFPVPYVEDDAFVIVAAAVQPVPEGQMYVDVLIPPSGEEALLQVEPRLSDLSVYNGDVIEQVVIRPVPAHIDVTLKAAIVSNLVDLTLELRAAAGSMPYPATANVYEGTSSGTLLASFTYTTDGTKTKADDADLGGRALPAEGKKIWTVVVTDRVGSVYVEEVTVNAPRLPYFDGVRTTLASNLMSVDIFGTVVDPAGQGGTLEYWLPANATTPANPSSAPTGSVVIAPGSMPYAISPSSIAAFNDVTTVGNAFSLHLKFTATDGRTTGKQAFPLSGSMQFLVDEFGDLRAGSVHNGLVLAAAYRPYFIGTGPPGSTTVAYGTDRYFDSAALQPYKHNGSVWVVDNDVPAISYAPILRAGVVSSTILQADAARLTLVGANRITTDNMQVALALTVGQYLSSTSFTPGSSGWKIQANGDVEFNSGTFRGVVRIGPASIYDSGYDPSTKETPGAAQAKADAAQAAAISAASSDATSKANAAEAAARLASSVSQRSNDPPSSRPGGSALVQGDQWVETDAGNRLWIWNGSSWTQAYTEIDGGSIKTGSIQSTVYSPGSAGWKIGFDGYFEANNVVVRGTIYATAGEFAGSLTAATGTFAGNLSAAGGTFTGDLSGAGGTFAGDLSAENVSVANGGRLIMKPETGHGHGEIVFHDGGGSVIAALKMGGGGFGENLQVVSANDIYLAANGALHLDFVTHIVLDNALPTSPPGGTRRLWNDGGTVKIT